MSRNNVLFVVGCPRSGTSPFAKWLHHCGLRSVDDDRRNERYPAGYFEHMPILMFHKALERLPRGADHAIRMEPFLESPLLDDSFIRSIYEAAFRPVLRREVDFIKFPQLALSIDFLVEQFPDCRIVGIWRDPMTTFRSLVQKEFPVEMRPASSVKSILLWNLYAMHLCRAHSRHPDRFTLISIDDFLANPGSDQLWTRIGVAPAAAIPPAEVLDLRMWKRRPSAAWKAHYQLARLVARRVADQFRDERSELADQRQWKNRLLHATFRL